MSAMSPDPSREQQPHQPPARPRSGRGPEFYPPAGAWPRVVDVPEPSLAGPPEHPPAEGAPKRAGVVQALVWVGIGLLLTVCGVLTVLAIATDTGVTGLAVGFVLAVLPVVPVVATFLWLDRHEAEPASLLLFAFGWGAAVATLISLVLNTASTLVLQQSGGDPEIALFTVAPVVEETTKGLGVLAVLLLRRREFDGVVDGIVYAGMVGIGFAFIENVLYFGRAFVDSGADATVGVFVIRGIFSPFAHPLFTMATGVGIGIAVSRRTGARRVLAPLAGWLVAVLLHGAWNGAAFVGLQGFLGVYAFLQVPVFVGAVALALMARRREATLLRRHLEIYAATGWLSQGEARMLSSLGDRRRARGWASRTAGQEGGRAMRDFQELASEVAFLRERMDHGTAPLDALDRERTMLETMTRLRPAFTSPERAPAAV